MCSGAEMSRPYAVYVRSDGQSGLMANLHTEDGMIDKAMLRKYLGNTARVQYVGKYLFLFEYGDTSRSNAIGARILVDLLSATLMFAPGSGKPCKYLMLGGKEQYGNLVILCKNTGGMSEQEALAFLALKDYAANTASGTLSQGELDALKVIIANA